MQTINLCLTHMGECKGKNFWQNGTLINHHTSFSKVYKRVIGHCFPGLNRHNFNNGICGFCDESMLAMVIEVSEKSHVHSSFS